jgi:glutathione S-transferase
LPRLHDYILSPEAYTVRLMLALLGVSHDTTAVDAYPGGAPVPVFEDGDTRLDDPGLILTYLARTHGPHWMPEELASDTSHWLGFAAIELASVYQARRVSLFGQPGDLDVLRARGRAALRTVEDHLSYNSLNGMLFVCGDAPTVADIALFPAIALSHDCGIGHEDYPALTIWQRRIRRLPNFLPMPGIPDYF